MNESAVINWAQLLELRDLQPPDEPDVVEDLIRSFVEQSATQMARLSAAALAGNGRQVGFEAHAIKGSAAVIGAAALAEAAHTVEAGSASGGQAGPVLIDGLQHKLAEARTALLQGPPE